MCRQKALGFRTQNEWIYVIVVFQSHCRNTFRCLLIVLFRNQNTRLSNYHHATSGVHYSKTAPRHNRHCLASAIILHIGGGFAYRVEPVTISAGGHEIETTRIVWGEQLQGTAREILGNAEASQDEAKGALAEACDFLWTELEDGPVLVTELQRRANAAGISERTLKRAYPVVGAKKVRDGFGSGGKWVCRLKGSTTKGGQQPP